MSGSFSSGAGYLFEGFALLKRPRILPFVIIPLLLNGVIFYFGFNALYETFNQWLDGFMTGLPDWLSFIHWLLWPLFYLLMILLLAYGFTFAANLIGSPFYGLMAEQVELIARGKAADIPLTFRGILALIPKAIGREIQKLWYYASRAIPLLLLSLISLLITPLATLMPMLWFLFGAWMLAIQYIDYSFDNHQINFSTMRKELSANRMPILGFGSLTTFASMIPVFNIIVIPAAVCGGTLLFVKQFPQTSE